MNKRKGQIPAPLMAGLVLLGHALLLIAPYAGRARQSCEAYYNHLGNCMRTVAWAVFATCVGIAVFSLADKSIADTFRVNSCVTDGPGDGSQSSPFRTLREAVANAKEVAGADTILVRKGTYPENLINEPLIINTRLELRATDGAAVVGQHGSRIASLRVLTHNVAAVDKFPDCSGRGTAFGECVANNGGCSGMVAGNRYDIVATQEYWSDNDWPEIFDSCDNNPLLEGITSTGKYLEHDEKYLFRPDKSKLNAAIKTFLCLSLPFPANVVFCDKDETVIDVDGGLGIFTWHSIVEDEDWALDEFHPTDCRRQGFTLTRIPVDGTDVMLDVYNVHLCGECNYECRGKELKQLAKVISEKSRNSKNPVLVMGDFNIGAEAERTLYETLLRKLRDPRDVWVEVRTNPGDPGLTTSSKRIDYIFLITDPQLMNSRFVLRPTSVEIVQWTTNNGSLVSDHLGVEATIDIHDCQ